jgi:hypothetical protein
VELSIEMEQRMKRTLKTTVAAALMSIIMLSSTTYGQTTSPLTTGKSVGSAGPVSAHGGQSLSLLSLKTLGINAYNGANVTAIAVRMPSRNSPAWEASAKHLISDALSAGGINMTPHELSVLGDYSVCAGKISWYNTVYSETTPLWQDGLNPTGTWAGQYGESVQILLIATSRDGKNSIHLSQFFVTSASSDSSRLLSDKYSFNGTSYTDIAVGIPAEGGNKIATGVSSDTQCGKVAAIVQMKLFNGGASASVLQQVRDYEVGSGNFTISYTVGVDGDTSSQVLTSVSLNGPGQTTSPKITLTRNSVANGGTLTLESANTGYSYGLQFSSDLNTWGQIGIINDGGSYTLPFNSTIGFYRLVLLR